MLLFGEPELKLGLFLAGLTADGTPVIKIKPLVRFKIMSQVIIMVDIIFFKFKWGKVNRQFQICHINMHYFFEMNRHLFLLYFNSKSKSMF